MAGHSKWANIKRKKEVNDKARANIFAKLSRQITMAIVEGGGMLDPEFNVKLRLSIEKARQSNMPKENIQRAIEKGNGSESATLRNVQYEGFGPSGVAILIVGSTNNSNRTAAEVRNILERKGGKLGTQGSANYLFDQVGYISFDSSKQSEETVLLFSEELQSIDIEQDGEVVHIYFPFDKLGEVKNIIGDLVPLVGPEAIYRTNTSIRVDSKQDSEKILNLIESLEDLDDIHEVYTNAELTINE